MEKVNLSRLNAMIKAASEESSKINARMAAIPYSRSIRIFEKTDDAEMAKFKKTCEKDVAEFWSLAGRRAALQKRISYLRGELSKANRKYGVNDALLSISSLQAEIALKERLLSLVMDKIGEDDDVFFKDVKDAGFYKSAFTETSRVYALSAALFEDADAEKLRGEIAALQKSLQDEKDNLALLNQTKFVQIEEFSG